MIDRGLCLQVFADAVDICNPATHVHQALARHPISGRHIIGLAIGKAALAMARGAGVVARGLAITPAVDGKPLPPGWVSMLSSHPEVSERSVAAAYAAMGLLESADSEDVVLALISGGASALIELPVDGLPLHELRARVRTVMASGEPIRQLNRVRTALSAVKGGKLGLRSQAPIVTLVDSDVIGDDPRVIGSGPTVRMPAHDGDRVEVIAPMACFGEAAVSALAVRGVNARRIAQPVATDVRDVAEMLVAEAGTVVAWGEPTVRVPEPHGQGGRAQQLALTFAKLLRGSERSAFIAGSDGVDGPSPRAAAGAYVDGTTWYALDARGIDGDAALRRCDAGSALDTIGALVITGPTGINHGDVMIVG